MSRIILKKYDNGEQHIVVGWDRPVASYYWQEFNKEPEVAESGEGKWKVTSPAHKVRVYDTKQEAEEHQWDDWEEMLAFAGYMNNELPTIQSFMESLPRNIAPLVTERVKVLLDAHSQDPDTGSVVVDLTADDSKSFKVEVKIGSEDKWSGNALRWATVAEAEAYGDDLASRWIAVKELHVVPSSDDVNYKWENGRAVALSASS